MTSRFVTYFLAALSLWAASPQALAQCPTPVPVEGAAPPGPLPLFPADNWWNADVSSAPVDPGSASFIAFINNGGTRTLHPDFGGEVSPGSVGVYGFPWAVVDGSQPKLPVTFQYWGESDGVDPATGAGVPYYPIPSQAITQPHWVEGGAPGNVDQRSSADRHLLMIDCTNRYLYELYNVYYDAARGWLGGSGAFFDMTRNDRRPEGWTSADAGGLAIFPGLVRYDEAWNPAVTEIGHAFRVTVRTSNGHVYPASHSAGSTAGALPMGARLRLKATVNGSDPALRSSDPNIRKIFRAMQKHGLIVADNGSDLFVSGTFDPRWDNAILNPAFALLSANDFEVLQLGWTPSVATVTAALGSVAVSPSTVVGGAGATGTLTLTAAAPTGGALVSLSSASTAAVVPASVTVPQGATSATFAVATSAVSVTTSTTLSASYGGATRTAILTVSPAATPAAALTSLSLSPTQVVGGTPSRGTVTLSAAAPSGGAVVQLTSSRPAIAAVPASVTVPAGATSASFTITTVRPARKRTVTVSATYAGVTRSATLTVTRN